MKRSLEQLHALLGDGKVSTSPSVLEQHGRDGNFHVIIAAKPEDYERVQTFQESAMTPSAFSYLKALG